MKKQGKKAEERGRNTEVGWKREGRREPEKER